LHRYGVRDIERLLGVPRSTIRALVEAGFVRPERGPRNAWHFSFQDLVVLRTAQALAQAKVPPRRITRAMRELRRHAQSGQYSLALEAGPAPRALGTIEPPGAAEWLARARALEGHDAEAAIRAYEKAVAADPARVEARIDLGLLLHETGRLARAERVYREAIAACGGNSLLHYNLGVLLSDLSRKKEALEAYREALRADPRLADGHYNLALLYEELGKPKEALRHMAQYRRLTAKP
jgi:tetratricopeptide (TPR) repeat protein